MITCYGHCVHRNKSIYMPDINSDFEQRIVLHTGKMPWVASPVAGVDRRMLDRLGDEVARATSIVRYAPDSRFSPHVHSGGEEFLVLDGVFEDEHGQYPRGSYVRNPPTSRHTPGSTPGCIIFVKLWQFDLEDRDQLRVNINEPGISTITHQDRTTIPLFEDKREMVCIEQLRPGATLNLDCKGGAEFLVLEGSLMESGEWLRQDSWCRLPDGYEGVGQAGDKGCRLWIKTGHLLHAQRPTPPET